MLIEYEPEDLEQLLNPPQLFRPISNVSIEMFITKSCIKRVLYLFNN
jgi:hypothetical protein